MRRSKLLLKQGWGDQAWGWRSSGPQRSVKARGQKRSLIPFRVQRGDDVWTHDAWENPLERVGRSLSLGLAAVEGVDELKERLPDGVGKRDLRRVDEGDVANAPSLERSENGRPIVSQSALGLD